MGILSVVISVLESLGLKLLGMFFTSTAQSAQQAGVDQPALDYMSQLVDSAMNNSALKTYDDQYKWIFDQAAAYLSGRGLDIAISLLDSLVSLALHHFGTAPGAISPTISTILVGTPTAPVKRAAS